MTWLTYLYPSNRLDIKRGTSFNFGFVEYEDKRDAEDALKATDGMRIPGYDAELLVEWSKGSSRRSEVRSNECYKISD
ncbi:hypothetical protein HDU96_009121 [Phlyctochytrium bullatum]|nr:hypothetical protein HDU96_009121 [Phlyctochytrium bullatum]